MIQSPLLNRVEGLVHALTTMEEGSVAPTGDAEAQSLRAAAVLALGGDPRRLAVPRQVHGHHVALVGVPGAPFDPGEADGVGTRAIRIPLIVQGADCPLVLLCDAEAPALVVLHAGWRGIVGGVIPAGIQALIELGGQPERAFAGIFGAIGVCCYEVGGDVLAAFRATFGDVAAGWLAGPTSPGRVHLDLAAAIGHALVSNGLQGERLENVTECTACGGRLWSARGTGGDERHGLVAMLT